MPLVSRYWMLALFAPALLLAAWATRRACVRRQRMRTEPVPAALWARSVTQDEDPLLPVLIPPPRPSTSPNERRIPEPRPERFPKSDELEAPPSTPASTVERLPGLSEELARPKESPRDAPSHPPAEAAAGISESNAGESDNDGVPEPPPAPNSKPWLPPLEDELSWRGGSYLYHAEGDHMHALHHGSGGGAQHRGERGHRHNDDHSEYLRLPADWQAPQPVTAGAEFLGADPVIVRPRAKHPGPNGYAWEPRFVGYGDYAAFGLALDDGGVRSDLIGHRLRIDLDWRLTGTERFHVQFRPLGEIPTGGSFYQFHDPDGYVDNATGVPNRYWFEGQLSSILGAWVDPFAPNDVTLAVGKFPFALQNSLLMNDEIRGVVLSQNNVYLGRLSNLNWQAFYAWDDVDVVLGEDGAVYGVHLTADRNRTLWEATVARVVRERAAPNRTYVGGSAVKLLGANTIAARCFSFWEDDGASGRLVVLETNRTQIFEQHPMAFDYGVWFCNAFWASEGWAPIAGANLNRLRTVFETNPLARIAPFGAGAQERVGVAIGCQMFRDHENTSLVPELAVETLGGDAAYGLGLRVLHKTGRRSFMEVLGTAAFSDNAGLRREGVFAQHVLIF